MSQPLDSARHACDLALTGAKPGGAAGGERPESDRDDCYESETLARLEQRE